MALSSGTRIGPYEILSLHGAGGMGEVYRATDRRLGRTVAIKSLPPAVAQDPERLARFEREAKLLAALSHPNVASIHGLEENEGALYLILEFVEGRSLAERLESGALTARETLEAGAQIASAIEAAHARGIVHRDLKPANIMLSASGHVKVLDFGLAKDTTLGASGAGETDATASTGAGVILGTAAYMSPEQARGKPLDARSDIWSFGCVLFECLAGSRAFSGETASDALAKVLERAPDWNALPAATPPRLVDLVRRCLRKDPEERPAAMSEVRKEVAAYLAEISSTAHATSAAVASLAVLYFENLSSDRESDYFCAGITEDILTDLSKIKRLRVASRTAVARYKGNVVEIPKVAAELGVAAVLEGSVRRAGDRVRITAQLINAVDGFHLWAERYDRTLQDVFAVQEEIASSIASALRVALTPAESENLLRDRPDDARAYDLYLKGRDFYGRYTKDSLRYALELFEQAVAMEPGYARAWAGIADCRGQMLQWGYTEDPAETARRGLEAARRAIALDPMLPEAHKAEALVLGFSGDREAGRAALVRALQADPRFTPALMNLAVDAWGRADLALAERLLRRVLEIDPQEAFAITLLGTVLVMTDRDDETLALVQRLRRVTSDMMYVTMGYVHRATVELRRGRIDAIERAVLEGRAEGAERVHLLAAEAAAAAESGRFDLARKNLSEIDGSPALGSPAALITARAAVRAGAPEMAVRLMVRPMLKDSAPVFIRLDPALHALLDAEPFAPRRSHLSLIWPLEAPPLDEARRSLFSEVRIETGRPRPGETFSGIS